MTTHQHLFPGIQPTDFARMQEAFEKPELTCNYIDVCSPDYLTDHHNRDNEVLISTWVCDSYDNDYLVELLLESVDQCMADTLPMSITDKEIETAIKECISSLPTDICQSIFVEDPLDPPEVYFYAYLAW